MEILKPRKLFLLNFNLFRYSYFFEAFDGYHNLKETKLATTSFKYMLLAKIMNN